MMAMFPIRLARHIHKLSDCEKKQAIFGGEYEKKAI